ncbi:MAG TPA: NAD(P)-dependent oxidoreductase [Syntrophorhabdaceae bacterium]|nr:NAD(P)-dependent oxidoreductase [Syntrophorhabdaceae bacterium]
MYNSSHTKTINALTDDLEYIISHTSDIWEELRDQKIFITGGTGFFGCWLLESFAYVNEKLKLNAQALVLTRNYESFKNKAPHIATNPAITFHYGDIRDFKFPEGHFPFIVHAATPADAKLNEENPLEMFNIITKGTEHTLEFAKSCGVKKFLMISSGAVYGRQPPNLTHIPEDFYGAPDPTNTSSAYGEGKRAAELLCILYSKKFNFELKIARCFAFLGPYLPLDIHYAVGNFIRDGLSGGQIKVNGDGTPYRSYLYAADLAIWLWTILFKGKICQAYNVGSDNAISIAELANIVAQSFNPPREVYIAKKPDPGKTFERYVPSVKKIENDLKLKQNIVLNEAILRTIKWHVCKLKKF